MIQRTEKDLVWSQMTQSHFCKHCGQPAMLFGDGTAICLNDPDCLNAMQEDDEVDCAPEGTSELLREQVTQ